MLNRMPYAIALLLLAAPLPRLAAQPSPAAAPTCRTTLDSLDSRTRQNYAGFLLEIHGERRAAYDSMRTAAARAAAATSIDTCHPVLASYAAWYEDPHLFVFQSQAGSIRMLPLTEDVLRASFTHAGTDRDPIEGVWYDGPLRLGVVPDPSRGSGAFVAVVLASDSAVWPIGAVRAEFTRIADGSYATRLLTRRFAELSLTARIHKRTVLRLSPGMWGRAFPLAPADTGLVDLADVHRPRISVRERSVVVSIASHDPSNTALLDSLVHAHADDIAARPLLVVDLRGNEGGGSLMSRALHPYIASAERLATPYDSGATVMLSSPAQIRYVQRFITGPDTAPVLKSLLRRMTASPGALVPVEETPAAPPRDSSLAGDWRVAVLVDDGTVSAAEVVVLRALRSTRAVVVGEPTAGALDYQSVQIISLGTGDGRWALGYPTMAAHTDLPQRGMRGRGIAPGIVMAWEVIPDAIAAVEQRLLGGPPDAGH
jgi:hypothetical protein